MSGGSRKGVACRVLRWRDVHVFVTLRLWRGTDHRNERCGRWPTRVAGRRTSIRVDLILIRMGIELVEPNPRVS